MYVYIDISIFCFIGLNGLVLITDQYKLWVEKLHFVGVPVSIMRDAQSHSPTDVIDLLIYVEDWLKKRKSNNGVVKFEFCLFCFYESIVIEIGYRAC